VSVTVGVSGVGSIGLRHARLLAELPDVAVVLYDAFPRSDLPGALARATWLDSYEALLGAVDAVVIATPDAAHAEQASAALRAGIPALVEKPVALSAAEARALGAVAEATGTPLLVGYVLRHTLALQTTRTLVAENAAGAIASAHASLGAYETLRVARSRFADAREDSLVFDYSHEWDYLRWLLGPISRVAAVSGCARDLELVQEPNVFDGALTFAHGATGTFHLDYVQEPGFRGCTLVGDRGTIRVDVGGGRLELRRRDEEFARLYRVAEPRDAAFTRQLEHFLDVVAGRAEPCVDVADGIAALEVAEAVADAARRGLWVDVGG
jgi:predicted dehydrogenase